LSTYKQANREDRSLARATHTAQRGGSIRPSASIRAARHRMPRGKTERHDLLAGDLYRGGGRGGGRLSRARLRAAGL